MKRAERITSLKIPPVRRLSSNHMCRNCGQFDKEAGTSPAKEFNEENETVDKKKFQNKEHESRGGI